MAEEQCDCGHAQSEDCECPEDCWNGATTEDRDLYLGD